jgi:hypothetical protein
VASFLIFPQPDPLFSSKSVASFLKSFQLSAISRQLPVFARRVLFFTFALCPLPFAFCHSLLFLTSAHCSDYRLPRPSKSATVINHHIFQSHGGFPWNKPFVFLNMAAKWVRTEKLNPRSLLLSIQFGFGPAKSTIFPRSADCLSAHLPVADCLS